MTEIHSIIAYYEEQRQKIRDKKAARSKAAAAVRLDAPLSEISDSLLQPPPAELPAPPPDSGEESDGETKSVLDAQDHNSVADEVFFLDVINLTVNFNGLKMDVDQQLVPESATVSTASRAGSGAVPASIHFKKKVIILYILVAVFLTTFYFRWLLVVIVLLLLTLLLLVPLRLPPPLRLPQPRLRPHLLLR